MDDGNGVKLQVSTGLRVCEQLMDVLNKQASLISEIQDRLNVLCYFDVKNLEWETKPENKISHELTIFERIFDRIEEIKRNNEKLHIIKNHLYSIV